MSFEKMEQKKWYGQAGPKYPVTSFPFFYKNNSGVFDVIHPHIYL